ncbi:universal stress protein [Methylomonas sp. LL1]|uniref:universal stress protein n=1 Tax=Methylomonas sp. LL1 TaxID=2785785 RepID=UPI0018C3B15C|nr:universal stress protein [Methylomonas sp. LL1]QPK63268.1 universal stress protein [Methylomonas sp. LL1]
MQVHNDTVLACVDGSGLMNAVCDYAAWISRRFGAPFGLMHSIDHHPETTMELELSGTIGFDSREQLLEDMVRQDEQRNKLNFQQSQLIMQAARRRAHRAGIDEPLLYQRHGGLLESLADVENYLRVLVVGARGKNHEDQPHKIGAKLESIIRSLHKPILVVNDTFTVPRSFMIAYDGGSAAEKALDMVIGSPLYQGMICHLVCVNEDIQALEWLEAAANKLKQTQGIKLISQRLRGNPEQALVDYQAKFDIDLTVMGAFSHTRVHDLLLGSFTLAMLTRSHKPLLLLR